MATHTETENALRDVSRISRGRRVTITEMRQEIAELRRVGRQMANVCFNLGQPLGALRRVDADFDRVAAADIMWDLASQWDAIKRQ